VNHQRWGHYKRYHLKYSQPQGLNNSQSTCKVGEIVSESEKDKVVEESFPKEDANATEVKSPSFVSEKDAKQEKGKVTLTMSDVMLYIGKKTKEIHDDVHALRELLEKQRSAPAIPAQPIQPTSNATKTQSTLAPATADAGLEKVNQALAEFIADGSIEINADAATMYYIVRTKKFLGAENFGKIASVVRGLGGEYVSQGKASHFKIPRGK